MNLTICKTMEHLNNEFNRFFNSSNPIPVQPEKDFGQLCFNALQEPVKEVSGLDLSHDFMFMDYHTRDDKIMLGFKNCDTRDYIYVRCLLHKLIRNPTVHDIVVIIPITEEPFRRGKFYEQSLV